MAKAGTALPRACDHNARCDLASKLNKPSKLPLIPLCTAGLLNALIGSFHCAVFFYKRLLPILSLERSSEGHSKIFNVDERVIAERHRNGQSFEMCANRDRQLHTDMA